jgi:hypothetical protein
MRGGWMKDFAKITITTACALCLFCGCWGRKPSTPVSLKTLPPATVSEPTPPAVSPAAGGEVVPVPDVLQMERDQVHGRGTPVPQEDDDVKKLNAARALLAGTMFAVVTMTGCTPTAHSPVGTKDSDQTKRLDAIANSPAPDEAALKKLPAGDVQKLRTVATETAAVCKAVLTEEEQARLRWWEHFCYFAAVAAILLGCLGQFIPYVGVFMQIAQKPLIAVSAILLLAGVALGTSAALLPYLGLFLILVLIACGIAGSVLLYRSHKDWFAAEIATAQADVSAFETAVASEADKLLGKTAAASTAGQATSGTPAAQTVAPAAVKPAVPV